MQLKSSEVRKSKSYFTVLWETYQDFAKNTSIHGLKYTVIEKIGPYEKYVYIIFSSVTLYV